MGELDKMKVPFEQTLESLLSIQVWDIAKLFVSLIFFLYIVFALIIVKQVGLMAKTLIVPIDLPIKFVAWIHLGLAILTFLLVLIIL